MEENNRKGPGIFYAVTGIATLVVAIVGATFAFFAASQTDNTNIKGSTAEAAGITLAVTKVTDTGNDMIPLNLSIGDTEKDGKDVDAVDQFDKAMAGKCKDINGNNVCQVYKIVITNNSATSKIDVRGDLTITKGAENMKWQLLNLAVADNDDVSKATKVAGHGTDHQTDTVSDLAVKGELVREGVEDALGVAATGTGTAARRTLDTTESGNNTATYYVLIWLEEMGTDQGTPDANKDFEGTVNFNAVDAAGNQSGITASFA